MIKARNLSIGYDAPLLEHVDFEIHEGECIMLCGANGSGKSTLLKTIAGMSKPLGGDLTVAGESVMVPTHIPKVKGFTLRDFIKMSCFSFSDWTGRLGKEAERNMNEAIGLMGIGALTSKDISTLSDGEFQKGCIATALVRKANVIMLDEPTAFLDVENRIMVLETIRNISSGSGTTVIFSSHDLHEGVKFCDKALSIGFDGKVRISSNEMADKIETVKSGFRNKNIIFED